jgi:pimeloyl-ACP methyl ester carboxylesterase
MQPEIRYAKSGNVHIAYATVGKGPIDIVVAPGWLSNVGLIFENPLTASFYNRIASFARVIVFDKRGTGLSDKPGPMPTLEERMDDVRAVMESAGIDCAIPFGVSEGGSMSMLFAATYPEKTLALALYGSFAKRVWSPDYPWAPTPAQRQVFLDVIENHWHEDMDIRTIAPSVANDPVQVKFLGSYYRLSASPSAALELARLNTSIDVRHVLCCINVPTLVMHRTGDRDVNVEEGRWIASQIPGARFVELPGDDHLPFAGDTEPLLDSLE